jgi:WD40 repeat protein
LQVAGPTASYGSVGGRRKPLREFGENSEDLYTLAWHPDGQSLFCGDAKGIVKQWEFASGKCLREFNAGVLFKLDRLQDVGGVVQPSTPGHIWQSAARRSATASPASDRSST